MWLLYLGVDPKKNKGESEKERRIIKEWFNAVTARIQSHDDPLRNNLESSFHLFSIGEQRPLSPYGLGDCPRVVGYF